MKILYDAFDLALLRNKPLQHYDYPMWQVWLFLAAVSISASSMAMVLHTDAFSKALFVFCYKAAEYYALSRFMTAWLRLKLGPEKKPLSSWNGEGSLFTLLILLQGIDFIQPLLLWLGPSGRVVFSAALFAYGMAVLVVGLARATDAPVRVVIGGLILCAPMLMLIGLLFANMAMSWGWIDVADFTPPGQTPPATAPALPRAPA